MKKLGIIWILRALASQNSFAQCWTTSYVDFGEVKFNISQINRAPRTFSNGKTTIAFAGVEVAIWNLTTIKK